MEKWSIKDAKKDDIIYHSNGIISVYNEALSRYRYIASVALVPKRFGGNNIMIYPTIRMEGAELATLEQCKILLEAIKQGRYNGKNSEDPEYTKKFLNEGEAFKRIFEKLIKLVENGI